ncbi:hypothetical protein SAMN05216298_2335 [Glycomyces sambucus]|uniref:Uncharacterized protein n=1 Tax=Glycomyces sambucus TaxID=380244 RepID=A0A1G9GPH5_9ACTN|nr:hypothetical protein [Glycomyces sambucus]SDL02579.1 hypothetical protein SAMN05216298_2335 [Glycomyces sambucus]
MTTIVFVAPKSAWRRALATETRAAADAGHRVRLVAEEGPAWEETPLDPRVEVVWTGATAVRAPESAAVALLLNRLPLGVLRRAGRGPLRGPAARAAARWRRAVLAPLTRRRWPQTKALREAHRLAAVTAALADGDFDWIVLHEPQAVELGVHWLPALLEARPDLVTTFSFEPRAEAPSGR